MLSYVTVLIALPPLFISSLLIFSIFTSSPISSGQLKCLRNRSENGPSNDVRILSDSEQLVAQTFLPLPGLLFSHLYMQNRAA